MMVAFLYVLNYFIFSLFLTMFTVETGVGIVALLDYKRHRDAIRKYLLPVWGLDGTFAVFYIVNTVAAYPGLINVASLYIVVLLIGSIFFLLRSAFIAYSEVIGSEKAEDRYIVLYAISTVLFALIAISILTSAMGGYGINTVSGAVSISSIFLNGFNILIFVSVALIALFIASTYFKVEAIDKVGYLLLPAALALSTFAFYKYANFVFSSMHSAYIAIAISLILMAAVLMMKFARSRFAAHAAAAWFLISINLVGLLQYPYLLGGNASYLTYITNGTSGPVVVLITGAELALLLVAMLLFSYINFYKKDHSKKA